MRITPIRILTVLFAFAVLVFCIIADVFRQLTTDHDAEHRY